MCFVIFVTRGFTGNIQAALENLRVITGSFSYWINRLVVNLITHFRLDAPVG